jgi:TolA-binding protein/opacity protein-like surface antigen
VKRIVISTLLAVSAASLWALDYTPSRYQQLDYFGGFGDNTAMFINPASIAEADQAEVMAAIYSTVNNQAGLNYVSAVMPFGLKHTFGVSAFINGASVDNATIGDGSFRKDAIFLGYGYRALHWLSVGADVSVINLNNFGETSNPIGVDVGVQVNPIQNSKYGFLKVGASVQNAVMVNNDNTTNLNLGTHWMGFNRSVEGRAEVGMIDIMPKSADNAKTAMAWAAGVAYYISPNVAVGLKQTREGFPMLTFAGNAKRLSYLRYLNVELDVTHDGISFNDQKRGLLWNVKATTRFGPTREEREGAKRYARLIREPELAFQEAMRLYVKRDYLAAAYAFGKVIVRYPTYRKADAATYYQGRAFENLRMNDVAKKIYASGIKVHDASDYVPKFYYQQMNVAYKERNLGEVQKNYNIIVTQYGQSDVRGDADYVMGQAYFDAGQNTEARKLLENIRQDDPNFGYASYTLGLIATKESKLEEAKTRFEAILSRQSRNKSERELQEAAAVKLGHVLYTGAQLTRAVELYKQIPTTSSYYDEAQLAAAWCFIRNNRWDDAQGHVNNIMQNAPTSILIPECYLVKGYAQMQKKEVLKAKESFETVLTMLGKGFLSDEEIAKRKAEHSEKMKNFPATEEKVYQLSLQLPYERVLKKRADAQPELKASLDAIEDNFKFQDQLAKQRKFDKDKERLQKDAEYAKATVQRSILDGSGTPTGGDGF